MALSSGESFEADTLVWTTGVRAHPAVARMGFRLDDRGRVLADEFLRVRVGIQPERHRLGHLHTFVYNEYILHQRAARS